MTNPNSEDLRDRAAVRFPPPLIFVGALSLGWALQAWLWPLWFPPLGYAWSIPLGIGALAAGLVLALLGVGLFRKTGQKPEPWTPTPELITTGVYAHTRNPMYVAMGLIQLGLGVALQNSWMVILLPASMAIVYWIAVRHEEAYLLEKFGVPYQQYMATVRRWI